MKFIMALMSVLICFHATAASHAGLQSAFDEFIYTVEVDNNKSLAAQNLHAQVEKLKAEGLTNQDIFDSAIANLKNPSAAEDIKKLFNMYDMKNMSTEEFNAQLVNVVKMSQSTGASWSGRSSEMAGIVLLVVVTAWIIVGLNSNSSCVNCSGSYYDSYYGGYYDPYYYDYYYWDSYYYDDYYYYY